MKKLTGFAVALLFLVQSVFASAPLFYDVDYETSQGQAILRLTENEIVNGMGNGYFSPEGFLTRAQFVKIVNGVFGYTHVGEKIFSDVEEGMWYYNDVYIASAAGYIQGVGGGFFAPDELVTREQACVIINNILNMELIPYYQEPADYISPWAKDSVLIVLSNQLIKAEEGNILRATEPMTRGEACEMLDKCFLEDVGPVESLDLKSIAKEELEIRLNRVIKTMKENVIPQLTEEKAVTVSNMVVENMEAYLLDNSHDYIKASEETFEVYRTIPKAEREIFKELVQKENKIEDLMLLYEFFYVVE